MKTWLLIAFGIAVALGVAVVLGPSMLSALRAEPMTPPFLDANGEEIRGSIASIETVALGGVEQSLTIRGIDRANPVLLHLHGGPGSVSSPWASFEGLFEELERHFVLVHWDQRGAGKSYSRSLTEEDMTVAQMVSDTLELAELLKSRFGQERILLWGHSWGSGLGFETLRKDESPFYAFVAEATRPSWNASQSLGYEKTLALAVELGDQEAVDALESIHPFDPEDEKHLGVKSQVQEQLLVGDFRREGQEEEWFGYVFQNHSPEYPRYLIAPTLRGMELSNETLGREILEADYDHMLDYPVATIPIYFVQGRYDFNCPLELVETYYEILEAPVKQLIVFEESAHGPHMDEPERFARELVRIRDEILGEGDS